MIINKLYNKFWYYDVINVIQVHVILMNGIK